ncbi:cytochrome P450 2U1, partial [Trichonephila inaurata madagascariensis]
DEINLHKTSQDFRNVQDFINSYLEKISDLSNKEDVKHTFSEAMLEGNLAILFLGASDTIFSSLGWLYRLISKHKDIQEKVHTGFVKASQDIHINGYIIPKGSEITANLWALHHDPAYWDNPEEFLPERFLTDGGTKLIKNPPSYAPFSIGRRNCPGETIAWMEILFYFSETLKRFEVSAPPQKT